ncbi:MAG: nucleotidyltransferase domain-containing protein [bacterium]|nr:nucleotidyltransferase domain-containing protein [bacterium]
MTTSSKPEKLDTRVHELVRFYTGRLGRPLSFFEVMRGTSPSAALGAGDASPLATTQTLDTLIASGDLRMDGGFITTSTGPSATARTAQDFLLDQKWRRFLRFTNIFQHAPFIEAVFVGGSLALGNVTSASDFDLLIVVRPGRMFTARYILLASALLRGVRRRTDDPVSEADKFCLNHFVTGETWSKPPHNLYRRELYRNLVPVWGDPATIRAFIEANRWCGRTDWSPDDFRWQGSRRSILRKLLEAVLADRSGDFVERKMARPIALRRLKRYLDHQAGETGRVVVTDTELEFHLSLPYEDAPCI